MTAGELEIELTLLLAAAAKLEAQAREVAAIELPPGEVASGLAGTQTAQAAAQAHPAFAEVMRQTASRMRDMAGAASDNHRGYQEADAKAADRFGG